jgi:endogenous inhibitor of DNA gyrase (YacG/DUF329 family)
MNICKKCGKEFQPVKGLISYCSLECRNSRTWSEADKLKKSESAKKSDKIKIANKLIAKGFIKKRIEKKCGVCDKTMNLLPSKKHQLFCSATCYKISENQKNCGGYRMGSGVGKSGWYKGYWCDSSWELAWVIYNLENNIFFERNKKSFEYFYDNKLLKYFPDFIIDDIYYEIKGYVNEKTTSKIKQFDGKLVIIGKKEIKKYINYVTEKYGHDFIKLYENNPYNKLSKTCLICGKPCKEKNVVCSRSCSGKLVNKYRNGPVE